MFCFYLNGAAGLRISLHFLLHCIANLFANSSVSPVPTLRTRLVRSSKPGPPDVQQVGQGALDKPDPPDVRQVFQGVAGQTRPARHSAGRTRSCRTSPTRQTSGRSGERLQDRPDPPDVRQVGRGAPGQARPARRPAGRARVGSIGMSARPARRPAGRASLPNHSNAGLAHGQPVSGG